MCPRLGLALPELKAFPVFAAANRASSVLESPSGFWNKDGGWVLARQNFFERILRYGLKTLPTRGPTCGCIKTKSTSRFERTKSCDRCRDCIQSTVEMIILPSRSADVAHAELLRVAGLRRSGLIVAAVVVRFRPGNLGLIAGAASQTRSAHAPRVIRLPSHRRRHDRASGIPQAGS